MSWLPRRAPPHSLGCWRLFRAGHPITPALCQASGPPDTGPQSYTCLHLPITHTQRRWIEITCRWTKVISTSRQRGTCHSGALRESAAPLEAPDSDMRWWVCARALQVPDLSTPAHREHQTREPDHTGMRGTQIYRERADMLTGLTSMDTHTMTCAPECWQGWHTCREHRGGCPPGQAAALWAIRGSRARWVPTHSGAAGPLHQLLQAVLWGRTDFLPALPVLPRCTSRTPRWQEGWPWAQPPR